MSLETSCHANSVDNRLVSLLYVLAEILAKKENKIFFGTPWIFIAETNLWIREMILINSRNNLELLNMESATRKNPKSEIEVYLTKFPNAVILDIREFIKSGTTFQQ